MSPRTLVAVVLIVIAVIAFAYQGITYKTRGKTVDVGPIHVETEKKHHIPIPPVAGAIALVGGVALLVTDGRSKR